MNEIIRQLKEDFDLDCLRRWGQVFLKSTGLKIGDIVTCRFYCSHGTSKNSYTTSTTEQGIIKQDDRGVIYVESCRQLNQSYNVSNGRQGRYYKSWWEYNPEYTKANLTEILDKP